jgi:hypothetical protein
MPKKLNERESAARDLLRSFKAFYGLTVDELSWMFYRSPSTIKRKLSGDIRVIVISGWIEDKILALAAGVRPHRWPDDLPPAAIRPLNPRRRGRILHARRALGSKRYPEDPLDAQIL